MESDKRSETKVENRVELEYLPGQIWAEGSGKPAKLSWVVLTECHCVCSYSCHDNLPQIQWLKIIFICCLIAHGVRSPCGFSWVLCPRYYTLKLRHWLARTQVWRFQREICYQAHSRQNNLYQAVVGLRSLFPCCLSAEGHSHLLQTLSGWS